MMKNNILSTCTLLLCAATACILQVAVARPILGIEEPSVEFEASKLIVKFSLHSTVSGLYVRMHENGSVDASGNAAVEQNAKWNLYMIGDLLLFENAQYQGKFLVLSALGNQTILTGHNINLPLTKSDVETLLRQPEIKEASGDGEELSTLAADEDNSEEEKGFSVSVYWQNQSLTPLQARFKVTTEDGQDCYLAFNESGEQLKNLCEVSEYSPEILFKLLPIF